MRLVSALKLFLVLVWFFAASGLFAQKESEKTAGRVEWPAHYTLEVLRPLAPVGETRQYLANVVQNLILDELSLQRHAITRGHVSPTVIEYAMQANHDALPVNERQELLAAFPAPAVLPLKIIRKRDVTPAGQGCAKINAALATQSQLSEAPARRPALSRVEGETTVAGPSVFTDRYVLQSRIAAEGSRLKIEVDLCHGSELLHRQTTLTDEQEMVAAVARLMNPIRAKLTGDAYAMLDIATNPVRASVYLDGQFLGKTPLKYSYLVSGTYLLTIKKDGFQSISEKILAATGNTVVRNFALAAGQGGGSLEIITNPAGAKIYLDADYKGLSPKKLDGLTLGTYRLHLLLAQKGEVYKTINLTEKQPTLVISESLSGFFKDRSQGLLGLSYKTWYWVSLAASAVSFGTAIGFYVWRDGAQEDILGRLSGKSTTTYTQADYNFISERNAAYDTRNSLGTTFMVSAGVFAALSIVFFVQHLFSADEAIVLNKPLPKQPDLDIRLGSVSGATGISAHFRF